MNQRNPAMKLIASSVVFTFFVTSLGITPETFAATGVSMRAGEVSSLTAAMLSVPAELGQVTETVMGDPKAPAFIHIQSAHGNYQAEKNIEKLLGYIEKNSTVKTMFLEGAAGKLNPELFRIFPGNPDFNRKVTDKLMQEGYLTGPEVFMINSGLGTRTSGLVKAGNKSLVPSDESRDEGMNAFGVEDLDQYKKDREAFISVVKKEKTAENYLMKLRASIDKRFGSKLNKDLLTLVRQEEALGSGTVSFASWIKTLGEGSKKHLKTDLYDAFYQDQYPSLIRYFRLQAIGSKIDRDKASVEEASFLKELEKRHISKDIINLFQDGGGRRAEGAKTGTPSTIHHPISAAGGYSTLRRAFDNAFEKLPKDFSMKQWPAWTLYAQFTILMQEMESKGLHEETVRLKEKIQTALAKTSEEKEYLVQARQLYLLKRLFALELTRTEYEELKNRMAEGGGRKAENVKPAPSTIHHPLSGEINALIKSAIDFYSTAVLREQKMFQNALKHLSLKKQDRAVIVTGGFHADGLKKLAAAKRCSYLQITPRIQEVSKRDHEVYLRSMLGNREIETSQIAALLGLTGQAQRVAVTGMAAAKGWLGDIRRIISDAINSESNNSRLKSAFSKSFFGVPMPTPVSATVRSEVRQNQTTDHRLQTTAKVSPAARGQSLVSSLRSFALIAAMAGMLALTPFDAIANPQADATSASSAIQSSNSAVLKLILDLQVGSAYKQLDAADALIKLKDPSSFPALIEAMGHGSHSAAEVLSEIGDLSTVPGFIKALNDSYYMMRITAINALGKLKDPSSVPALITSLEDENSLVQRAAADALGELKDPSSVPALIRALDTEDFLLAGHVIGALGKFKNPSAIAALRQVSKNYKEPSVREAAFYKLIKLGEIKDSSDIPRLKEILRSAKFSSARDTAAGQALYEISKFQYFITVYPVLTPIVLVLGAALGVGFFLLLKTIAFSIWKRYASIDSLKRSLETEKDNDTWFSIAEGLVKRGDKATIERLAGLLASEYWQVRAAGVLRSNLAKIGSTAASALSKYDEESKARWEAARAAESSADSSYYDEESDQQARSSSHIPGMHAFAPLAFLNFSIGGVQIFKGLDVFFVPGSTILSAVFLVAGIYLTLSQTRQIIKLRDKKGNYLRHVEAWRPVLKKFRGIENATLEQVINYRIENGASLASFWLSFAFVDFSGLFISGTCGIGTAVLVYMAAKYLFYGTLRDFNKYLVSRKNPALDEPSDMGGGGASRSEMRSRDRESYLMDIARADGTRASVLLREGGNYTVEFAMHPVPTKKGAMEDYVRSTGLDPKRGIYIGNENQSVGARDGAMAGVSGLSVLGVDGNQQGIIPGVRGIGAGVAATGRELERIAGLSDKELPLFIGLDIDDTVLGLKRDGSGSASKEGLMADRRVTAEALAKLALRGVHLVFFTDSSSKVAFERIGGPLGELLRSQLGGRNARIDFYSSLMTTKSHVDITPAGIKQLFDADYGRPYRMDQEVKQAVLRSIGSIRETVAGMVLEGPLGHYYDSITRDSKGRRVSAESFEATYPNFYKKTPSGNMSFPFIEERDPMDDGSVSVIALAPFPSIAWTGNRVPAAQEDARRQFVKDVLAKAETAGIFQNVRRSEMRGGSSQGMRLNVVVKLPVGENGESVDIAIREGGEASIDITRADDKRSPVTKKTVMEEFLREFNVEEENGYFIGALTSSPEDRDGILTGIDGLPVLAVDYDQGQVMDHPQVKKIGAGPGATTVWLQELLLNHSKDPQTHRLPEFIGFSVDNVIVGRKPTTADLGGRTLDTETLATDREDTLIALAELIQRGVRIGFFADHEGELMKEKVLDPLAKYLNKEKIEPKLLGRRSHFTIPLYANGVITKYGLNFNGKVEGPSEKWSVEQDKNYHSSLRLGRKETEKILEILGSVTEVKNAETDSWEMVPQGLLGEYYAERLTEKVEDKHLIREELKTTYPNFRYHLTAGKNVRPPVVEIRDERGDGTVAEITVLPLLAATMRPSSSNGDASGWRREDDERRRFFKILVERLGGNLSYHKQAVASPKESPERGDHQLVGQEIAEGVKLTQQMLDSVHQLMGVEDLILDQRLPEDRREEATSRALAALKMMHQKLRNRNQTLESIQYQPDLFRDLFGVRPVIMAGGYATRFSSFIHKTAARAGLKKTNIGYTVQGSYRTPGVKPAVVVGEKILGLLVKDEYLAGYDRVRNAFVLDPKIAKFSPGSRKKEVTVQYLDPEKVRSYLGVDPGEVEIFQTTPEGGHGDHLVQVSSILKTRNKKTAYFQVAFGEMSTAIDRSLTNPSLITYLEILGQDAQGVAGGKPSEGKIESKGNFFFNGDGKQLLLYTDWGIIPHLKKMKGARYDKVWSEFGEKLAVLEKELETLRARHEAGSDELKAAVRNLRGEKDNEYFSISDDGYVLTQELLRDVNKDMKDWDHLDPQRKEFIKNHFAVMENGSSGAELLISSNTAIFQADLLYELKTDVDAQYLNGGYADYDPKNGMDDLHLTRMWTVDPKNGETQALAWNLFGMIADRNLKASGSPSGSQYETRFVNVGDTPASIKDSARQRQFAEKIRGTEGEPRWVGYRPLTVAEGRAFSIISGLLIEGKDSKAKEQLEGLLKNKAYFSGFRHVVQALFARSQDQKWQADLLEVLESIRSQPPFFHDLISTDRPNGWVLSGVVESAIMEAVDAGVVGGNVEALTTDLHYATQIIQLRNRYAEKVRKNGKKREEYLLERLSFLLTESLRNEGGKIEDLLKFRDKFSPEHPAQADMPESAKEKPQVITITGGTSSGTLWVPVLESLGIRAHAGIKSVVGNTDDGGSTAKLIKTLNDAGFGITPPLGDLMNATSGAMTLDKKMHLMGDGGRISVEKGKNPTFEEMVVPFIHRTIADAGIEAQPLELQPDFFYFARILLAAVRKVDELNREIQNRNETLQEGERAKLIEVNGQSIRNIYLLGFLVNKGLFEEADKNKKDKPAFESREAQKKYDQALNEAVEAAGAEQFSVTLSSLDPKTLYAKYQGHTLAIGIPSTDPKTGKPVTAYPNPAVITREADGSVSVTRPMLKEGEPGRREVVPVDASQTIRIEEGIEIAADLGGIALRVDGKLWRMDESDPDNLTFTSDEGNVKVVMPDGTGRELDKATGKVKEGPLFESETGARVYWVSRFVKKQTNITELINLSKILKIGLLDGFGEFVNILSGGTAPVRLEPNHALLESIRLAKPQDVILIGPGSHFTSIMPHLMVQGMPEALQTARGNGARVILVMNGSFDNETAGYSPYELLETLEVTIKERSRNLRLTDMITDIAIAVPDHRIAREKIKEEIEKRVERMLGSDEFNEVFKARSLNSLEDKQKLLWDEAALEEAVRLLSKDAKRKTSLGDFAVLLKKDKHDPQSRLSKKLREIDEDPGVLIPSEVAWLILAALEEKESILKANAAASAMSVDHLAEEAAQSVFLDFLGEQSGLSVEQGAEALRELQFFVLLHAMYPQIKFSIRTDVGAASDAAKKSRGGISLMWEEKELIKSRWPELDEHIIKFPTRTVVAKRVAKREQGKFEDRVLFDPKVVAETLAPHINRSEMRGNGDVKLVRAAAKLARDHDDSKIADEFEAHAREIETSVKQARDLDAWVGRGEWGLTSTKRWFFDRAKIELERNANGKATFYLGNAHIRGDEDDTWEAAFGLSGEGERIVSTLQEYGIEAVIEDISLPGDLHPAESYATLDHELYLIVPLAKEEAVQNFLNAIRPLTKQSVRSYFAKLDAGVMKQEAKRVLGGRSEVRAKGVLPRVDPSKLEEWRYLKMAGRLKPINLAEEDRNDYYRRENLSVDLGDFYFDASKNHISQGFLSLLIGLAEKTGLRKSIDLMFAGAPINETEKRAVFHPALRNIKKDEATGEWISAGPMLVDGKDVMPEVLQVLRQMADFVRSVHNGTRRGYTNKPFKNVVVEGIGGSYLGPEMAVLALEMFKVTGMNFYFVANVDGADVASKVTGQMPGIPRGLDPEETLVVVLSKTYTTQETIMNASTTKEWLLKHYQGDEKAVASHFVAVSTATKEVDAFGITPDQDHMFPFWDWVGGRYSMWSAIGLPIMLAVGPENFYQMLAGAHEMDEHFRTAPFAKNIPVLKALIDIWNRIFRGMTVFIVSPYAQLLSRLGAYLQQLFMESNGKSVDRNGDRVTYNTSSSVFGEPMSNGQHAYKQQGHQGDQPIPEDFIGFINPSHTVPEHHGVLLANLLGQKEAQAVGKTTEVALAELRADQQKKPEKYQGWTEEDFLWMAKHKTFEGNKPSNLILIDELTPRTFGKLIAMYEHQVAAEGFILNIFSFDQWGVELGKVLAKTIHPLLKGTEDVEKAGLTSSTAFAIRRIIERTRPQPEAPSAEAKIEMPKDTSRSEVRVDAAVLESPIQALSGLPVRSNELAEATEGSSALSKLASVKVPFAALLKTAQEVTGGIFDRAVTVAKGSWNKIISVLFPEHLSAAPTASEVAKSAARAKAILGAKTVADSDVLVLNREFFLHDPRAGAGMRKSYPGNLMAVIINTSAERNLLRELNLRLLKEDPNVQTIFEMGSKEFNDRLAKSQVHTLRAVLYGGETIPEALLKQLLDKNAIKVTPQMYNRFVNAMDTLVSGLVSDLAARFAMARSA